MANFDPPPCRIETPRLINKKLVGLITYGKKRSSGGIRWNMWNVSRKMFAKDMHRKPCVIIKWCILPEWPQRSWVIFNHSEFNVTEMTLCLILSGRRSSGFTTLIWTYGHHLNCTISAEWQPLGKNWHVNCKHSSCNHRLHWGKRRQLPPLDFLKFSVGTITLRFQWNWIVRQILSIRVYKAFNRPKSMTLGQYCAHRRISNWRTEDIYNFNSNTLARVQSSCL